MRLPLLSNKLFARQEIRYVASGVASVIIEYVSFLILIIFTPLLVANTISFIIGVVTGFVFHKLWSFAGNHTLQTSHQVITYVTLSVINLLAANALVYIFVEQLGMTAALGKILSMGLIAGWSFLLFKYFIFRHK